MSPKNPVDPDDFEDSGVHEQPLPRPPTAPGVVSNQPSSARKALAQINELRRDLNKFEGRQHDFNTQMLEKFDEHAKEDRDLFSKIGDKMDTQTEVMSKIREQNAAQTVELRQSMHDIRNRRMIETEEKKAEIETEKVKEILSVEDTTHQKKFRRDLVLKVISILGPVFAAVGGAVALLLQKC